jgi:3-dehydroquinate dehydratase II
MRIHIVNGPNLNLLGVREPHIYGNVSFEAYIETLRLEFSKMEIKYFQSNHEGALLDHLHSVGFDCEGIVLNAGALSHQSYALADAVQAIQAPVIEVHISQVYAREAFRHTSLIAPYCMGQITGFGLDSYALALACFARKHRNLQNESPNTSI